MLLPRKRRQMLSMRSSTLVDVELSIMYMINDSLEKKQGGACYRGLVRMCARAQMV